MPTCWKIIFCQISHVFNIICSQYPAPLILYEIFEIWLFVITKQRVIHDYLRFYKNLKLLSKFLSNIWKFSAQIIKYPFKNSIDYTKVKTISLLLISVHLYIIHCMLFSYYFRDDCCGFHQESLHDMDAKRQLLQHAKENHIRCAYKIQDQRSWWRGTSPLAFKLLWIHLIAGQIFLLTIHRSRQTWVIVFNLI